MTNDRQCWVPGLGTLAGQHLVHGPATWAGPARPWPWPWHPCSKPQVAQGRGGPSAHSSTLGRPEGEAPCPAWGPLGPQSGPSHCPEFQDGPVGETGACCLLEPGTRPLGSAVASGLDSLEPGWEEPASPLPRAPDRLGLGSVEARGAPEDALRRGRPPGARGCPEERGAGPRTHLCTLTDSCAHTQAQPGVEIALAVGPKSCDYLSIKCKA